MPDNSVLPVRPASPDWSASPVAAITGRGRSKKGAEVQLKRVGEGTQTTTSTVRRRKNRPAPCRGSSKDTPSFVTFEDIHPFTEDVGPTKILPASAKAMDFFYKCLTTGSWSV